MELEARDPKRRPRTPDDIRRETFSFYADARLVALARALVDGERFRSKSEVIEEGLRLVVDKYRERLPIEVRDEELTHAG